MAGLNTSGNRRPAEGHGSGRSCFSENSKLSDCCSAGGWGDQPSPDDNMHHPRTTGQAAQLLDSTEPRLADLVRKGKIRPEPMILAGRRQWEPVHILKAAEYLGCLTDDLRRRLGEEVGHAT